MPGLRIKLVPVVLILGGIATILAAACGGGQETSPQKLIPDGSNLIAHVNINGMLADNGLLSLVSTITADQENPINIDDILEEALRETGVDLRQFAQAVIFTDISRSDEFSGVIAKGRFDELALISSIRNAVDDRLVSAPYKGNLIYSPEAISDAPSISILPEGILIVGTSEAVRAVIDVHQGDRGTVSGNLIEAFNDLGGGLFRLQAKVPAELVADYLPFAIASFPFLSDALSGEGVSGLFGSVERLRDLEFVGLALAQNGQIVILRVNLKFSSQESAEAISELLGGLITLASSFSPDPALTELLEKLQVGLDDDRVSIRLELERPEIADLISSLTANTRSKSGEIQDPPHRDGRVVVPGDGVRVPQPVPPTVVLGDEFPIMPTSFHVAIGEEVGYSTTPPTSGDHWERWTDCGFYPEGLPDELITHNLEHGNIVVSYNLPLQAQIDRLQTVINNIPISAVIGVTRYYGEIPEGQIALSAWGRMYKIGDVDQKSIGAFFSQYAGALGPERIPC